MVLLQMCSLQGPPPPHPEQGPEPARDPGCPSQTEQASPRLAPRNQDARSFVKCCHFYLKRKGYQPEFLAHGSRQGHRMNASEKNKKRNKNYKIRPKENEAKKKRKGRKDVSYVVWNSVTAFIRTSTLGLGRRDRKQRGSGAGVTGESHHGAVGEPQTSADSDRGHLCQGPALGGAGTGQGGPHPRAQQIPVHVTGPQSHLPNSSLPALPLPRASLF